MAIALQLSGQRFRYLTVLRRDGVMYRHKTAWICLCDCGNFTRVSGNDLTRGHTITCGCHKRFNKTPNKKTCEYTAWRDMIKRCTCQTNKCYKYYGGRGISVCQRWKSFETFLSDMGERPIGLTLDRINNDGNYEPENCRWATRKEQTNNRRTTKFLEYNGKKQSVSQWAEELGIPYATLVKRQQSGMSMAMVLSKQKLNYKQSMVLSGLVEAGKC